MTSYVARSPILKHKLSVTRAQAGQIQTAQQVVSVRTFGDQLVY